MGNCILIFTGRCELSGDCVDVCPTGALQFKNGGLTYDPELCYCCELCVKACPNGAIEVHK